MTMATKERPGQDARPQSGFRAQLRDASLLDLVQMECLSHAKGVFRITSGRNVGYLFFDLGRIVHAETANLFGEAAAFEILQWDAGRFDPCMQRQVPDEPTIDTAFQELLMRVAIAKDHGKACPDNLVTLPTALTSSPNSASGPPSPEPTPQRPNTTLPTEGAFAVRLNEHGVALESRAGGAALAPLIAYSTRICELLGDTLGLDKFVSLEAGCQIKGRTYVAVEPGGTLLGVAGVTDGQIAKLRGRLT